MRFYCPTCALVTDEREKAPICRHNIGATGGPRPTRTVPLPTWHPFFKDAKAAA